MDSVINSKKYHDLLAIVKGFRNGAVYGCPLLIKVPKFDFHMPCLRTMINSTLKVTFQHSRNLAFFVTIYKSLLLTQRKIFGKENQEHAFVAGVIGGYLIFGTENAVNQQIVLYLFSRISTGLAKLAVKKNYVRSPDKSFSIFAAVTWGIVMWLFRHHPQTLQGGLQTSMTYLYNDSDVFNNLNTLLWHNKETAK